MMIIMKKYKKMSVLILALIMIFGSAIHVNAATTTQIGEYGSGTYSVALTIEPSSHASASVSYTPESPSDTASVRLQGYAYTSAGNSFSLAASGSYNSCYARRAGAFVSATCNYYVESSYVEYLQLYI